MGRNVDVLHVVPAYFPIRGGIEVLVENLCEGLRERHGLTCAVMVGASIPDRPSSYVHRGVVVETVAPMKVDVDESEGRLDPSILQDGGIGGVSQVFSRVRSVLDSLQPRIVHVHGSSSITSPLLSVVRSRGTPVILHLHGTIHEHNRTAFRRSVGEARWVCAVSQAVAVSIQQDCARTGPIRIIRNGVPDPLPSTRPFDQRSPSVAMIGRLSEEKGFDDGLRALKLVQELIPNLIIRLAGDGPERDSLRRTASNLGLLGSIDFFGELPHDRALRVVAGSDITLVPSKRVEGFSLTAVEAALLERPVVGTATGGLPETILDGKTGLLVPPGEAEPMAAAIRQLLDDPELRNRLGARGRERALTSFGLERFVDEMADLYATVLEEGSSVDSPSR